MEAALNRFCLLQNAHHQYNLEVEAKMGEGSRGLWGAVRDRSMRRQLEMLPRNVPN